MTDVVPTEGHGTGTTARRASGAPSSARRRRAPSFKVTAAAAVAGFLVVFELLAFQLRSGHDPAIGSGQTTAQVRGTVAGHPNSASSGSIVTRGSGASAVAPATQPIGSMVRARQPRSRSITTRSSGRIHARVSSSSDDAREQGERA